MLTLQNQTRRSNGTFADLQNILQKMSVPLVLSDSLQPDNPIVAMNSAFVGLVGYSPEEMLGKNCRFLQSNRQNSEARLELRAALESPRKAQVVLQNERADGSRFWNFLTIIPIADKRTPARFFLGAQW